MCIISVMGHLRERVNINFQLRVSSCNFRKLKIFVKK